MAPLLDVPILSSPKNVPLCYCMAMDFDRFETALSRIAKGFRVNRPVWQ